MERFLSAIDKLNKWVGTIMSFVVLVVIGITLFEVIGRFVFNRPTTWAHETTALVFGFYFIMGGGYILLNKAHIRVDILWSRLSLRKRAIVDLITCGFGFLFLGMLLRFSVRMALESVQLLEHSGTPFNPPLYPAKICLVIGVALILLQLVVKTIRDLHLAVRGAEHV